MKSNYHFSFEDLIVYQKAMEFAEIVNQLVQKFPKLELFNLSSQFQRAADSIGYNIAEGSSGTDANLIATCKLLGKALMKVFVPPQKQG